MPVTRSRRLWRLPQLLRLGVGAGLVLFPARVAGAAQGRAATQGSVLFTRVLGLRHLAQAVVGLAAPDLLTPARGAVIDAVHAVTMLPLLAGPHRRGIAVNVVAATGFVGLGLAAEARRASGTGQAGRACVSSAASTASAVTSPS